MVGIVRKRGFDVDAGEQFTVPRSDLGPGFQNLIELLQLTDAERRGEVVEPVVEPEPPVLEASSRSQADPGCGARSAAHALLRRPVVVTAPPSPVVICLFG